MTTENATSSIPSKRATSSSDPLISHGRHFGRTHRVFEQLLDSYPGLLERLRNGSEEEILHVGELIGKGASGARGDDTKSLKPAILDWLSQKGAAIQPPLHRNSKIDRGFNHELTGSLLCPAGLDWHDAETRENLRSGEILVCGDQWPVFLDPWCGLLRSPLADSVSGEIFSLRSTKTPKPRAPEMARLHGMNCVTAASIAYIATQCSLELNTTTDSETFYHSLLDLFEDPDESKEVDELLTWWNRQVFPTSSAAKRPISTNSAWSKIRIKRLATKNAADSNIIAPSP
ncbi:hypothetical protein EDD22DRAFT_980929 [Suillus occidentalis]|nr:hypothetical protein EDD22DRAFT_980929 [Suillus occidentalis]